MKVFVHDYAGHPFQVELSRQLARRGHHVVHVYFSDLTGPKGVFDQITESALHFIGVSLNGPTNHPAGTGALHGFTRHFKDLAYGRAVAKLIRKHNPHLVISGNTPTQAQQAIVDACKRNGICFVFWVQDVFSVAVTKLLTKRFGVIGKAIGGYYTWLDRRQYRASDAIVVISEDFSPLAATWAGDTKVSVIENWAPIHDLPVGHKDNEWSRRHNLHTGFAYLYAGTLGRKHNAEVLLQLAQRCPTGDSVVVVGQGFGVPQLQSAKARQRLDAMKLLPIQPQEQFKSVLATADILLASIEADAGTFAVPSKVLSYLCAARPILLAAPRTNLAARTVLRANAGIVVDPTDHAGFLAAADTLRGDEALRTQLGANGRRYAENTFDLTKIADRFEDVFAVARKGSARPRRDQEGQMLTAS